MNILVTGGRGFIGHELVKKLIKLKHNVWVIDNESTYYRSLKFEVKNVTYLKTNVTDINRRYSSQFPKKFHLCFHLAALSRIQPSFEMPHDFFDSNVIGTYSMCEWAKKNKVRMIYAGSSSMWQDHTLSPYSCYKKMGEDLCKLYRNVFGCNIEIARFYNVYGKSEQKYFSYAALIGRWRGQIEQNLPITIVSDGNQKRDFTHVDDIIDGLLKIAFSRKKHKDAWELGSGFQYSINEVAQMFVKRFNCKVQYIDNQKGNYLQSRRVNDDAITRLGWKPKDRLKKYIKNL